MAEQKTVEQRKADISVMFERIDSNSITLTALPQDIQTLTATLKGGNVIDLLSKAGLPLFDGSAHAITTKKTKRSLYEVYTTGYSLMPIGKIGTRTIVAKISLFAE